MNRLRRTILIQAILIIALVFKLHSQGEMQLKQLSLGQGASSAWLFDVAEDSLGYVWIGGHTGLDRFDGKSFKSFRHDPDDTSTLSENQIYRIHVTPENHLLLSTIGGGLNHYNSQTGKITRFPIELDSFVNGFGSHKGNIVSQPDGTFIGLGRRPARIIHFEASGKLCLSIPLEHDKNDGYPFESPSAKILKIGERIDEYLVLNGNNCYSLNINSGQVLELTNLTKTIAGYIGTSPYYVSGIFLNDQLLLLGLSSGQILFVNINTLQISTLKSLPINEAIRDIGAAQDGGYWLINNTNRLFHYNPETGIISEKKLNFQGLENIVFVNVCQSKDSTIWIGTFNHGVLYHRPSENVFSFESLSSDYKVYQPKERFIYSIIDPIKPVAYTSFDFEKSILKTNLLTGEQTQITLPDSIYKSFFRFSYRNDTTVIFHDRRKVYELSLNTYKSQAFRHPILSEYIQRKSTPIVDLFSDTSGIILIEYAESWVISFPDKEELLTIDRNELGEASVKTSTFLHDHTGTYILTERNVYFIDRGSKIAQKLDFNIPLQRATAYAFRTINIHKDSFYLGCVYKGVYKFARNGNHLELCDHWHTSNHLLSNNIQYSQIRQDSILWLSTGLGLQLVNLNQNRFLEVSHTQNIPFLLFDRPLTFNKDGYFVTNTDQYVIWAKEDQLLNTKPAKLILSSFKVYEEEMVRGSQWPAGESIQLKHYENFFQLSLSLLRHTGTLSIVRIKLDEFDSDWKTLDQQLNQVYTNVPPGKYTLRAEVINQLQQIPLQTLSIPIIIEAPFWQTWWFRLLVVLIILGIFILIYRLKINSVRREEAIKTAYNKQLAELEMQSLRSQMNPHFMFNSLNSIKHYILKNEREKASDYLSNFATLIRSILNFSHAKFITLEDEINTLKTYIELEQLRFSKGFEYEITMEDPVNPTEVLVQPLIFQPYIENAIWHGLMHKDQDRMLLLNCKIVSQQLICTIEDNGIGREKASQIRSKSAAKKSYGLQITEARMKSQDANAEIVIEDLYDSAGQPTGTKVTLILPLKKQTQTTETI